MAYIVREDGERFVVPSYRDVLSAKQKSQLKKEILALSQNYGEYITLQRKNPTQYEVAFSPDPGYLLGETVWHYFKRPLDMVYCEAIPNTTEAILVIVKDGSVYLDGRFPVEGISEELVIFLTQKNNFEIYIQGNVPISKVAQEDKFSFDSTSVKSFNILETPIFAKLPLVKIYQLQLVDPVLKSQGIGVFPTKPVLIVLIAVILGWFLYSHFTTPAVEVTTAPVEVTNPYQDYINVLTTPTPDQVINEVVEKITLLSTLPGWTIDTLRYAKNKIIVTVKTPGSKIETLEEWAHVHDANFVINAQNIEISWTSTVLDRPIPMNIYPINTVMIQLLDGVTEVYPGNNFNLNFTTKTNYTDVVITIGLTNVTPTLLLLIGQQFKDLPILLQTISLSMDNGMINGSINVEAVGN